MSILGPIQNTFDDLLEKLDVRLETRGLERAVAVALSRLKDINPGNAAKYEAAQDALK